MITKTMKISKGIQIKWTKIYISMLRIQKKLELFLNQTTIEEYEYEDKNRLNFKNNIYLGTISRVEPSLQAAFVDFGRLKHGFLAFNDIQSDYYQIPSADKEKLKDVEEKIREDLKNTNLEEINNNQEITSNNDKNENNEEQNRNLNNNVSEKIKLIIEKT